MNNIKFQSIVLFSFFVLNIIFSCKPKSNLKLLKELPPLNKIDTIIKEIPFNSRGEYVKKFNRIAESTKTLKLQPLFKGFDSIYIRLWYEYSFEDKMQIVELLKTDSGYLGKYYFIENFNSDSTNAKITTINKSPKSTWENVFQKLSSFNIEKLPSWTDVKNYNPPMDGSSVTVEVATKVKYKFYQYLAPKNNRDLIEADNMEKIMETIEEEFNIKQIRKI